MPYVNGEEVKVRILSVDRDIKSNWIEATCNEQGLGMTQWGWNLD